MTLLQWLDRTDDILPHDIGASLLTAALAMMLLWYADNGWAIAALVAIAVLGIGTAADLYFHGWVH